MSASRILVDENVPAAEAAFGTLGTVATMAGRAMTPAHVRDADALVVRSVTRVDARLLDGAAVRFVGSVTAGTDHVDEAYLRDSGIAFAHAPGSNADAVADYVVAALLVLARRRRTPLAGQTLGVVGCGQVGGRVARRAASLGLDVLRNDPPRAEAKAEQGKAHPFVSLDHVLAGADIVTLHTPLTAEGPHPTRHLVGAGELRALHPGAWLLNAARGPVVDGDALKAALADGHLGAAVLDVWEGEPTPDPDLVRLADLATPHVAGYALDGKVRGTAMIYDALRAHLDAPPAWTPADALPEPPPPVRPPDPHLPRMDYLHACAHRAYAIEADDRRFRRSILDVPEAERGALFSRLRRDYPRRREMQAHRLAARLAPDAYHDALREALMLGRLP